MFGKKNKIKYDVRPLLIALGVSLAFILAYGLFLTHRARVDMTGNDQAKNTEKTEASSTRAELEKRTQKAKDALEEMRAKERKVPTAIDYQRAALREQAAIEALRQMHKNDDRLSGREMTTEERAAREQAALDALNAMHDQ